MHKQGNPSIDRGIIIQHHMVRGEDANFGAVLKWAPVIVILCFPPHTNGNCPNSNDAQHCWIMTVNWIVFVFLFFLTGWQAPPPPPLLIHNHVNPSVEFPCYEAYHPSYWLITAIFQLFYLRPKMCHLSVLCVSKHLMRFSQSGLGQ